MVYQLVRKYEDAVDKDYCDVMMHIFSNMDDACYAICEERLAIVDSEADFREKEENKVGKDLTLSCTNFLGITTSLSKFSVYELDERIHVSRYEDDGEAGYFLGIPVEKLSEYEDLKVDLDWEKVRKRGYEQPDLDTYDDKDY